MVLTRSALWSWEAQWSEASEKEEGESSYWTMRVTSDF